MDMVERLAVLAGNEDACWRDAFEGAARGGHAGVVMLAMQHNPTCEQRVLGFAAEGGHDDLVTCFARRRSVTFDSALALQCAACGGRMSTLRLMLQCRSTECTRKARPLSWAGCLSRSLSSWRSRAGTKTRGCNPWASSAADQFAVHLGVCQPQPRPSRRAKPTATTTTLVARAPGKGHQRSAVSPLRGVSEQSQHYSSTRAGFPPVSPGPYHREPARAFANNFFWSGPLLLFFYFFYSYRENFVF